jgi:hypothetical protein
MQGQLTGCTFEPADELVKEICEMTSAIPQAKLEAVFLQLEERLQQCIERNGADVD